MKNLFFAFLVLSGFFLKSAEASPFKWNKADKLVDCLASKQSTEEKCPEKSELWLYCRMNLSYASARGVRNGSVEFNVGIGIVSFGIGNFRSSGLTGNQLMAIQDFEKYPFLKKTRPIGKEGYYEHLLIHEYFSHEGGVHIEKGRIQSSDGFNRSTEFKIDRRNGSISLKDVLSVDQVTNPLQLVGSGQCAKTNRPNFQESKLLY
jgi:hypothetical protein